MRGLRSIAVALAAAGAAACATGDPAAGPPCPLAQQRAMVVAQLFFGRAIAGRDPLTDAEWRSFVSDVVGAQFPDGFTAFDGEGQWRDPRTGAVAREPSKVLIIAAAPSPDLPARLDAVIDAYRTRFAQQSVGVMTATACAAF